MANTGEYLIRGGLPAEEYRLVEDGFMIQTPVDDRGLVDIYEHVKLVKQTLSPEIDWKQHQSNIHHFYWPARLYKNTEEAGAQNIQSIFCGLPVHKGLLPIQFQNWLHRISEPPEVPEQEVMEYRIESWKVANDLFQAVRNFKRRDRCLRKVYSQVLENPELREIDEIEKELLSDLYGNFFNKYEKLHQRLFTIPEEFRLVDPDTPFDQLNKELGKLAGSTSLILNRLVAA